MDDISTFITRPTDKLESALFDRFILENYKTLFERRKQPSNLGELIATKLGAPDTDKEPMATKKSMARSLLDGHNYGSNKKMNEK